MKRVKRRIQREDYESIWARWEFGHRLVQERRANGGKKLPDKRLEKLATALGMSRSDIQHCMRLAAQHSTKAEVYAMLRRFGSWARIVREGLYARREPR